MVFILKNVKIKNIFWKTVWRFRIKRLPLQQKSEMVLMATPKITINEKSFQRSGRS